MNQEVIQTNTWMSKAWEMLQIIVLIALSIVLIFNPVGSIHGLITTVGFFLLVSNLIYFVYALKKGQVGGMLASAIQGLLGVFLVINSLFSLKLLSILIGVFIIIGAAISLLAPNTSGKLWKKTSPVLLLIMGIVLIIFPSLGIIALSYLLAGTFIVIAFGKIGELI